MLDSWSGKKTNKNKSLPLVSRESDEQTIVRVKDVAIGGHDAVVIAGPCSVESREQVVSTALAVKQSGAVILRGGAYKPRTSPYDFQGLGVEGLKLLREAGDIAGMPVVTEVMSEEDVEIVCEYADMIQIGARNMQNFALLKKIGKTDKPILLKRGASATVKEWLSSAEYIMHAGNSNIVLCERGIKTFDNSLRNTLGFSRHRAGQRNDTFARHRRSVARDRKEKSDKCDIKSGNCRRCGRHYRRSSSATGNRSVGQRTAINICRFRRLNGKSANAFADNSSSKRIGFVYLELCSNCSVSKDFWFNINR